MDYYPITLQFWLKKVNKQIKQSTNLNRFIWEKLFNQKKQKVKNKWINNNNNDNNNNNNNNKNNNNNNNNENNDNDNNKNNANNTNKIKRKDNRKRD